MKTPQELARDVDAGKYKTAYYLMGVEDFRIVEAEKYIVRHFLPNLQITTNYNKINGRRTACKDILAELSNFPMLGERQVFGISEIQSFKPTEVDRIFKLLDPPDPNRIVIFSSPSARMPKKKSAFYKKISGVAEVVEFRKLSGSAVATRIQAGLKKENIAIKPDALNLLVELIGGNSGGIEAELSKFKDFKDAGESVTVDDIKAITSGYEVFNIFELADFIIAGQTKKVLKMMNTLITGGNSPVAICSLLLTHFILLYLVKNGYPLPGNRRFLTPRYKQQGSTYNNEMLERILLNLAKCDANLRGGALPPKMELEMLVLGILGERKKPRG
jgi:DNA polymerase III subunit delta